MPPDPALADLRARLAPLMLRDSERLGRRLDRLARRRNAGALAEWETALAAAERRVASRAANLPTITYPDQLPVSQRREDILAALRDNQVVVVAGETGSGKTTQLPKMCLELGRGVRGMIGHTQPRRIAARAVADRVAEELGVPVGAAVGFAVRFADRVSEKTLVKVMTDGILLAEIQRDRLLTAYDTIIVDEAHERSLNIDFLLGYLTRLLPRRPDLKLVITSATIDTARFAQHFDAPVVEVSGRSYPVEVRYRPLVEETCADDDEADDAPVTARDQTAGILDAVDELVAEGPGDILVFLSGEREIRDTADALTRRALPQTEVLPLYARLSASEQHRVFAPHPGRRIVLSTNVAETSLTVPGIRYVVDPGTARVSRYSHRLKVQRLPIEPVSQASANQRAGRCGRVADGVCIRLYAEPDYLARPLFTDPEILRTHLASVILAMASLGLGEVEDFPFLDPPDRRSIRDGVALLEELGALHPAEADPRKRLTPLGRQLAALPVDPRMARMVVEAGGVGCLHEVLVIASALSIQDPRERPVEERAAADALHRRFADDTSDFLAYLRLWDYLSEQQRELSSSAFRRLCKAEYLHYLRVREWQDLYSQLRQVAKGLGLHVQRGETPPDPQRVHAALLAGLLSHLGLREGSGREYAGARGARFAVWPGSALAGQPPRLLMAAELVETSRLWARTVARIQPEWVEPLAGHLLVRTYSEPHWDSRRGETMAYERVTLYGVPLVTRRRVGYGRVDPAAARELFIRHALVAGEWHTAHRFWHANQRRLAEVADVEDRLRRRDLVVDEDTLVAFYDARVGAEVVSTRTFDAWWKKARRGAPDLLAVDPLRLRPDATEATGAVEQDYPDTVRAGGLRLPLGYRFDPGAPEDGVTADVSLAGLGRLSPVDLDWLVPGHLLERVTALIRGLPKPLRQRFVPAPDHARAVLDRIGTGPRPEPLVDVVGRELHRLTGVAVPRDAWSPQQLPAHLRPLVRVHDADGTVVASGRDLPALQHALRAQLQAAVSAAAAGVERRGLRAWPGGTLPRSLVQSVAGEAVTVYPALVDEGDTVAVRALTVAEEQPAAMWAGTRRLLLLSVPSPVKTVLDRLPTPTKLALAQHGRGRELFEDCLTAVVDHLLGQHGGPAWDEEGFGKLREAVRRDAGDLLLEVLGTVARVLTAAREVEVRLDGLRQPAYAVAVADVRAQLGGLVGAGFVTAAGVRRLGDLHRYLRAARRRLDRLPLDPGRDRERTARIGRAQAEAGALLARLPAPAARAAARQVRWMLEELRVNVFAQEVGTPYPVSEERIARTIADYAG